MKIVGIALVAVIVLLLILVGSGALYLFRTAIVRRLGKPGVAQYVLPEKYEEMIRRGEAWFRTTAYEEVSIVSYDGLRLCALVLPAEQARGTVVLMHGYRSMGVRDFSGVLRFYHEQGLNIVLPDQRACGASEGKYICFGIKERYDCRDWCHFAAKRYGEDLPILLDGISMGATTVMLATELELPASVRAVIADCGFTSPYDIMKHVLRLWFHLPAFPMLYVASALVKLVAGFGIREASTLKVMEKNSLPVFFAHGEADDFVPCEMTCQNYEAATSPKELFLVKEAGHGLCYPMEKAEYERRILTFFDRHLFG